MLGTFGDAWSRENDPLYVPFDPSATVELPTVTVTGTHVADTSWLTYAAVAALLYLALNPGK